MPLQFEGALAEDAEHALILGGGFGGDPGDAPFTGDVEARVGEEGTQAAALERVGHQDGIFGDLLIGVGDQAPDPELYRRVLRSFEDCWLEDPHLDAEIRPLLDGHETRITWDAPIHSVADIAALPFPPRMLNSKPSRFGPLRELFDAYDYCARAGIRLYGGGQFELGPGRGQAQYLASMFHPNSPNDLAPPVYNRAEPSG